ncbi:MAG: YebC/PmpR family DNA-binding transcriptional regulator [Patescibacteria group bacterium]|jgi:YebC/PmpR family DNA-binding regulatory protein
MSGHSKWHNIQERKGKQDARRSGQFTKMAKSITVAAQKGGGDITMNFSLRLAVEKSKAVGMPKENIERAIKRGTGELKDGIQMEEALYEGFGPAGVAILIKVVTDNKNRAISDVKHILNEHGGNMGSAGSVQWMFQQWGIIVLKNEEMAKLGLRDEAELALIELGAEDIQNGEEGEIEVKTKVEHFQKLLLALKEKNIEIKDSGLKLIAKDLITVDEATEKKLNDLFGAFEENDDVEDYFTNAA